jgi:hypothetical protein
MAVAAFQAMELSPEVGYDSSERNEYSRKGESFHRDDAFGFSNYQANT